MNSRNLIARSVMIVIVDARAISSGNFKHFSNGGWRKSNYHKPEVQEKILLSEYNRLLLYLNSVHFQEWIEEALHLPYEKVCNIIFGIMNGDKDCLARFEDIQYLGGRDWDGESKKAQRRTKEDSSSQATARQSRA